MSDQPTRPRTPHGLEPTAAHVPATPTPGGRSTTPPDPNRTVASKTAASPVSGPVPGYDLLGELGRGGMGVVYKALDTRLNRVVALKMILGPAAGAEVMRFRAEAEAMAAVRNPHVAQVYEAGEAGGTPYLAMELLPGGTLSGHLGPKGKRNPARLAALVQKVAVGVAAAHEAGIVHRDLKPGNVLFDENDEPKVTDFGLAKRGTTSDLTQTGAVMGTPAYMAPEQAAGGSKFVGPPADVWALGVILYEALTGTRPFTADSTLELMMKIGLDAPERPRKLAPSVPRDLELICLKCLEKAPHERYPTAGELADDLERFGRGEPISVRPVGPVGRAVRWAKREPWLAGMGAVALLGLAVAAGTGWWSANRATKSEAREIGLREQAETESEKAKVAEGLTFRTLENLKTTTAAEKVANEKALKETARALSQQRTAVYAALLNQAQRDLMPTLRPDGSIQPAFEDPMAVLLKCPPDLRGWEWRFLADLARRTDAMRRAGLSQPPSGPNPGPGPIRPQPGMPPGQPPRSFFPPGVGTLAPTTTTLPLPPRELVGSITHFATSADGARALTVSIAAPNAKMPGGVLVWDTRDLRPYAGGAGQPPRDGYKLVKRIPTAAGFGQGPRPAVAFSPDGRQVAFSAQNGEVEVWTVDDRATEPARRLPVGAVKGQPGTAQMVTALAYSPDGKWLGAGMLRGNAAEGGAVRVWDAATGKVAADLRVPRDDVSQVAFSRDGKFVAAGTGSLMTDFARGGYGQGAVRVWEVRTGREVAASPPTGAGVMSLGFAPDGRVAYCGGTGPVYLWPFSEGRAPQALPNPMAFGEQALAFSPDGKRLAVAYGSASIVVGYGMRVWDTDTSQELLAVMAPPLIPNVTAPPGTPPMGVGSRPGSGLCFLPDGSGLAFARDGRVEVLTSPPAHSGLMMEGSRDVLRPGPGGPPGSNPTRLAVSADGRKVAKLTGASAAAKSNPALVFGDTGALTVWDAATGGQIVGIATTGDVLDSLAFLADGALASVRRTGGPGAPGAPPAAPGLEIRVLDTTTGRDLRLVNLGPGTALSAAFSADGRRVVTGPGASGPVKCWDAVSGKLVWEWAAPEGKRVRQVRFAPDGRAVFALVTEANAKGPVRVVRLDAGTGAAGAGADLDAAPAGLAVGGKWVVAFGGGAARWLDAGTLAPATGRPDLGEPARVELSADGARVLTSDKSGAVKAWEAATGKLLYAFSGVEATAAAIDSGPSRLAVAGPTGVVAFDLTLEAAMGVRPVAPPLAPSKP